MATRIMESSPSSRLHFFEESGAVIKCPVEGQECGIDIDMPSDLLASISLKLAKVLLPVHLNQTASGIRLRAQWPACGPGHHELLLECGKVGERRIITVVPRQFTENDYLRVIYELAVQLPESTALGLLKCGGLSGMSLLPAAEPTVEQEYFKLRNAIAGTKERQGIVQFLPAIERDCHQVLLTRHVLRSASKARKPDTAGLVRAITLPGNVSVYGSLYNVYDVAAERSYDTYENRLVKAYIQAVHGRLSRLQARLETTPSAFAGDIEALFVAFRLVRSRALFLNEVKTPFITLSHITMVLLKKPAYRAVLDGYLELLKQYLVRLEEPALAAPLNEFPFLYQRWGTLKVINVVLQVCAQSGFRCVSHPLLKRDKAGLFVQVVADGQPVIELSRRATGTRVRLLLIKSDGASGHIRSSIQEHGQFIAIEINTPGKQPSVILFDTKYTVAAGGAEMEIAVEPIKEDILKMLMSLNTTRPAEEAPAVLYAAILYPGQRQTFSPQVEALPARPSDGAALESIIHDVLRSHLSV